MSTRSSTPPRELAVALQRHARTLQALADHWSVTQPATPTPFSPYEGAEELKSIAALHLDGVLFMEGEGRPAELTHLIKDLRDTGDDLRSTGEWLATAMQASWDVAVEVDGLADMLGERHRIIANNWQAAHIDTVTSHVFHRAADILDYIDFIPSVVRADLTGARTSIGRLYSAADLCSDSAGRVHDNERRWRTFRQRVSELVGTPDLRPRG